MAHFLATTWIWILLIGGMLFVYLRRRQPGRGSLWLRRGATTLFAFPGAASVSLPRVEAQLK